MQILSYPDPETVARRAAEFISECARAAISTRGRFTLAVSGGSTPWQMLAHWVTDDIAWECVDILQVDERIAPLGSDRRNWTHLQRALRPRSERLLARVHAMPVDDFDPASAAERYAATLVSVAGSPAVLDLVQLGLGSDGHTASLVPGDSVLDVMDRDVAATSSYQGERRLTLTYPTLNRARNVLWLVVGERKAPAVAQLLARDASIPAGRVRQQLATMIADEAALRWGRTREREPDARNSAPEAASRSCAAGDERPVAAFEQDGQGFDGRNRLPRGS